MTDRNRLIEQAVENFHETYERLAPEYGYKTRDESAVPWADVPENNKALMRATVRAIFNDIYEAGKQEGEARFVGEIEHWIRAAKDSKKLRIVQAEQMRRKEPPSTALEDWQIEQGERLLAWFGRRDSGLSPDPIPGEGEA